MIVENIMKPELAEELRAFKLQLYKANKNEEEIELIYHQKWLHQFEDVESLLRHIVNKRCINSHLPKTRIDVSKIMTLEIIMNKNNINAFIENLIETIKVVSYGDLKLYGRKATGFKVIINNNDIRKRLGLQRLSSSTIGKIVARLNDEDILEVSVDRHSIIVSVKPIIEQQVFTLKDLDLRKGFLIPDES